MPFASARLLALLLAFVPLQGCGAAGSGAELIVQVVDAHTGQAIPWALANFGGQSRRAGAAGLVRFTPQIGAFALDVGAPGYQPRFEGHQVHSGRVAFKVVALEPAASAPDGPWPMVAAGASGTLRPQAASRPVGLPTPGVRRAL